jgi:hypothetical protein
MSVSVNIPEDLYRQARESANSRHVSVDDVISSAFAEQLAAWQKLSTERLEEAGKGSLACSKKCPTSSPKSSTIFDSGRH